MLRQNNNIIFSDGRISDVFQRNYGSINATIESESENYILKSLYNIELILQKKELARVVLLMSWISSVQANELV